MERGFGRSSRIKQLKISKNLFDPRHRRSISFGFQNLHTASKKNRFFRVFRWQKKSNENSKFKIRNPKSAARLFYLAPLFPDDFGDERLRGESTARTRRKRY